MPLLRISLRTTPVAPVNLCLCLCLCPNLLRSLRDSEIPYTRFNERGCNTYIEATYIILIWAPESLITPNYSLCLPVLTAEDNDFPWILTYVSTVIRNLWHIIMWSGNLPGLKDQFFWEVTYRKLSHSEVFYPTVLSILLHWKAFVANDRKTLGHTIE